MQGSYVSLRSSTSLFDNCDPMELQQDDSYFRHPLMLGERLSYVDTQPQYYDAFPGLTDQDSFTRPNRTHTDLYQNAPPVLNLDLPTSVFRSNGFRDGCRSHEALEGQEQELGSNFQPPPSQQSNQGFAYPAQPSFDGSYKIGVSSEIEAYKEDMTSSSTTPKIDSSPAMEAWSLVPEKSFPAFLSDACMPTKDSQEDDESSGDKPYARLIHEALMQAPGHRMMLREIYDWFVQNTTKPSESGTNGWQNSIRHNLSMNQVSNLQFVLVDEVEAN